MRRILPALFALACAAPLSAATFQNGSFELGTLDPNPCNVPLAPGSTAITGWTVIAGNVDYLDTTCWAPSQGTRSLDLVGTGSIGGVEQTFDTVSGQTYQVTFDLAGNPSGLFPPPVKNLTVTVGATAQNYTFDTSGRSPAAMGWTRYSFVFVASGSSSTISFVSNMAPSTFAGAALDNVRVQALGAIDAWAGGNGNAYTGRGTTFPPSPPGSPRICSGAGSNWNISTGPFIHPLTVSSNGTNGPVVASYAVPDGTSAEGICGTWSATATATATGDVAVAWNYSADHSSFEVTTGLRAFVISGATVVQSQVVNATGGGSPFAGQYVFQVQAGDFYGFTMTGSNWDFHDFLFGTLYLTGTGVSSLNLQSSANPAPEGSLVTFTATVTGANPVGTVSFTDGATPIAGCAAVPLVAVDALHATASCGVSSLAPGGHGIGAAYSGDMANRRSANMLGQTITALAPPLATPVLIAVVPTDSSHAILIGRVDGAVNATVQLDVFSASSCALVGVGTPLPASPITVTTDSDGYFFSNPLVPVDGIGTGAFASVQLNGSTGQSNCLVSSADNDSWPAALELVNSSPVSQYIDAPGKAKWYKFDITPGQRVNVTLFGLPADYNLAVFKDIGKAFASQLAETPADLTRLSAEYAPSVFSPSVFSPSVFSPSVFSPDAYSPSVFSPSVFSPSVFSPSVFSPSVFSPSVFSPSVFSPSVFSPSVFSPSVFSPSVFSPSVFSPSVFSGDEIAQAFSSAQTRSILGVSATAGTSDEAVSVHTWNNTGSFYVRVAGRGVEFSGSAPFTISVSKSGTNCGAVTDTTLAPRPDANDLGVKTILVTDSSKVALDAPLPSGGTLRTRITAFLGRPEIAGVLVDVALDGRVGQLKTQAAANATCPFAKNLVAQEIKAIIDAYRENNQDLRYVVIAGNDDAIPFFRYPDESLLGQESGYFPPLISTSASEASLRLDFVLGQDAYGSAKTISLRSTDFPIPGLAVGRLVETPAEMAGILDAYTTNTAVTANGVVVPHSSLVTGYDFLQDAADAVGAELALGTGAATNTLITANNKAPDDAASWTAADAAQKLLFGRHDVIFLAGHFSANSMLAADFKTSLITTELVASSVDLTNSIVFSAGCHAGYNLIDSDAIEGVTLKLDWPQAFAQKKATLIAGTGYQYGDTDFLEYSERLYRNFARQLRTGTGAVAVGEALMKAKQEYLVATPDIRGLHQKALLEATLFGLPMLSVNMPGTRFTPPSSTGVTPIAVTAGSAADLGLMTYDPPPITAALTSNTRTLTKVPGPGTLAATWLSGPGNAVVTNPAEPALPLVKLDVTPTVAGVVLRGVGFLGASYTDTNNIVPLTGSPTTDLRGVHTPFLPPVFFPMRLATPNYFDALAESGRTNLLVTPAQHRAFDVAQGTSTLRTFSGMSFRLYYSGLTQSTPGRGAALSDAPTIVRVEGAPNAGGAAFTAQVIGDPAAAIHEVWVTYTNPGAIAPNWTSLPLTQCAGATLPAVCGTTADSQLWKGQIATWPADGKYIVQAASGVGLVSVDDNLGSYYSINAAAPAETTIAFAGAVPDDAAFGGNVPVTVTLAGPSSPLGGKVVTVSVGGAAKSGTTTAAGSVTVQVPVLSTPGAYPLTASFAGDTGYLPSAVSTPFTVDRAVTSLAPIASGGALLTSSILGKTQPLIQEAVEFSVTGPQGPKVITATTDYLGRATLPPPGLPPGTYSVTQASFAGNATYLPASLNAAVAFDVYQFTGFSQPVDNLPALNRVNAGQAVPVKFSLGGNRGLAIFTPGSPASKVVSCGTLSVTDDVEETVTASTSGLQYDAAKDQYTYVWKTDKAWSNTCRVLTLSLKDGTQKRAQFQFKK